MVRNSTMPFSLVCLALILGFSIAAIAQQSPDKPVSDTAAKPSAAPRKAKKVWTNDDIPSRPQSSAGSPSATDKAGPSSSTKTSAGGAADDSVPKGMFNARPAIQLMKAWENRSLWVTNPPILGGCECFDFKKFTDCEIWSFDKDMRMTRAGGRLCEVSEFIVDKEPGHVPGDYGLIIGGIGNTYNVSFPEVVTPTMETFKMRDSSAWSFEVFDGPCSARAKK
jgi:hypothetical protein